MNDIEKSLPIRFVLIGCGNIGKKHAEILMNHPEAQLVAVIDVKEKKTLDIEIGTTPYFQSLDEFLNSGIAADVINIATPNYLHAPQAIQCLEAGLHVVLEKPMALNASDVKKVLNTEKSSGKQVFIVMQNRFSPLSQWLKEVVDSGRLGKIFMVQVNCFWNRSARYYQESNWKGSLQKDGGTLFTQYSHFLDIMYWLFGDIENLSGRFANYAHQGITEFEDSGIVSFDFVNGGHGVLNFSTAAWQQNMESSLTILAENGTLKIAGQYMEKLEYCRIKDYEKPPIEATSSCNDYGHYQGSAQNHHFLIQNVIDVLQNKDKIAIPSQDGARLVEMIEKIYTQRPIKLDEKSKEIHRSFLA